MQFPIIVPRGTDYDTAIQLFDNDGSPYDASGSTIALGVKMCANDTEYVISKVAAWDEDIGGCEFHFDPWDTSGLPMPDDCTKYLRMFYDIGIMDANDEFTQVIELSPFYVAPMATDLTAFSGDRNKMLDNASTFEIGFSEDDSADVVFRVSTQYAYDVIVDWGDGDVFRVGGISPIIGHTYDSTGRSYTVNILLSRSNARLVAPQGFIDDHVGAFFLKNVSELDEKCCKDRVGLSIAKLGKAITSIPKQAFSGCTNLFKVYLPVSLKTIDDNAFYNCPNLIVYYAGSSSQWDSIEISNVGNSAIESATIHYNYDYFGS